MTINEYQALAGRTINPHLGVHEMLLHGVFGLAAEAGEVAGLLQKEYQGHLLTDEALIKELGDVLWMVAEICTAKDLPLDAIALTNIEKLRKRYPAGFESERSLHRAEGDI